MQPELFVGVTTWNSEQFLTHCLKSGRSTTSGPNVQLGVVGNAFTDRSVEIARDFGADVRVERCSQSIALNRLPSMSKAKYALLILDCGCPSIIARVAVRQVHELQFVVRRPTARAIEP